MRASIWMGIFYQRQSCFLVGIHIHKSTKEIRALKHGKRAINLFKYGLDYVYQLNQ